MAAALRCSLCVCVLAKAHAVLVRDRSDFTELKRRNMKKE